MAAFDPYHTWLAIPKERRPPTHRFELSAHALPRRPVVERTIEHELHQRLEIQLMRRHAEHHARRRARRVPDGAGMTQAAVEADLVESQPSPAGYANGQVVAGFDDQTDRSVSARQLLAADGRKGLEYLVRRQHAADGR